MNLGEFRKKYRYDPVTDLLGQGGFGTVYKAYDTVLRKHRALKFFTRDADALDGSGKYDLISEIERAIDFKHDNICRYYGADILEITNEHGVPREMQVGIMELVPGGHLNEYLYRHPEYRESLLVDVLRGLSYLHGLHPPIIHRDLKPGNVLVAIEDSVPVAKITDFGISRTIDAGRERVSKVGTYDYMAPEQIFPQKFGIDGGIGTNVDLWSFGVLLYELLTGKLPFSGDDPQASQGRILESIVSGIPQETLERFPDPYRTVLRRCLVQHAGERAQTADELIAIFRSFAGQGAGHWVVPPPAHGGSAQAGRGATSVDLLVGGPAGMSGGSASGSASGSGYPSGHLGGSGSGSTSVLGTGTGSGRSGSVTVLEDVPEAPAARGRRKSGVIAGVVIVALAGVGMATYPLWHKTDAVARQVEAGQDGVPSPATGVTQAAGGDPRPTAPASLTVRCNVGCSWTLNGRSATGLPVGPDGRYVLPANTTARVTARAGSGDSAAQEKTVTPRPGSRVDLQFTFASKPVPGTVSPPGGNEGPKPTDHTQIDALMQTGYDKQIDDDLPGAYKAYSTAETLSKDGYRRQEAGKSKDNVLAACRDRGISCFGK